MVQDSKFRITPHRFNINSRKRLRATLLMAMLAISRVVSDDDTNSASNKVKQQQLSSEEGSQVIWPLVTVEVP